MLISLSLDLGRPSVTLNGDRRPTRLSSLNNNQWHHLNVAIFKTVSTVLTTPPGDFFPLGSLICILRVSYFQSESKFAFIIRCWVIYCKRHVEKRREEFRFPWRFKMLSDGSNEPRFQLFQR